jgi:ABC-type siderophore export system fused ATPase/permease subunit
MTLAQWKTGDIPVIQYEAENVDTAQFIPIYHYQDQALFNVDLIPVGHTQKRPELLFFIGMKRAGGSKTGKWLIDYWQPRWRPPVPAAPG